MYVYFVLNHTSGNMISGIYDSQERAEAQVPDWAKAYNYQKYLDSYQHLMKDVVSFWGADGIYYEVVKKEVLH